MNGRKRWLLVLLTMLLIGVGAAMPWGAAWIQDLYGVSKQESLPFDPVSLTLRQDSEIGDVLRLMSAPYDETGWSGETRLTVEEASATALAFLAQLDQYGLLESGDLGPYGQLAPDIINQIKASGGSSATPSMFISLDGTTAIIWVCHWKGTTGPSYEIRIDDATGKAVIGYIPSPHIEDPEFAYYRMEQWQLFFQDYYGVEITEIEDQSKDIPRFIYHIDPGDGLGELGIIVRIHYYEMNIVPCAADVLNTPLPDETEPPYPTLPGPYETNHAAT